jgi:hypothetical protein
MLRCNDCKSALRLTEWCRGEGKKQSGGDGKTKRQEQACGPAKTSSFIRRNGEYKRGLFFGRLLLFARHVV